MGAATVLICAHEAHPEFIVTISLPDRRVESRTRAASARLVAGRNCQAIRTISGLSAVTRSTVASGKKY